MKNLFIYTTSIGKIGIEADEQAITHLYLPNQAELLDQPLNETALIREAAIRLQVYLAGKLKQFDLPLNPRGTPFMQAVWGELQKIPYGHFCSYGDIARAVGRPKAFRAVGMANNRNPIPIFIPCHRVIGADGSLIGYGGGLDLKLHLLALEAQYVNTLKP